MGSRTINACGIDSTVEHRTVNLTSRPALVGSNILGRHNRADQARGVFDPVVGLAQAVLALDQCREGLRIRRLNSQQLS